MVKEGETLSYVCPCEPDTVICVFREGMGDPEVLTTSLIDSVVLGEYYCNENQSGPNATITVSTDLSQSTFFCVKSSDQCAVHFSVGRRPVTILADTCQNTSGSPTG